MALAQWMNDGEPPFDLWEVDIRRAQPFQKNRLYLKERVTETLGLLYADHFPYRQMATARGVRRSPIHEHLKARGAVFGEVAGWERANWYAPAGVERRYVYSFGRPNWLEHSAVEHRAVAVAAEDAAHEPLALDQHLDLGPGVLGGPEQRPHAEHRARHLGHSNTPHRHVVR